MGKHKKHGHHRHSSSSSSSSSSSDDEYKHLPKEQRKMMKKQKKLMKKGMLPAGAMAGGMMGHHLHGDHKHKGGHGSSHGQPPLVYPGQSPGYPMGGVPPPSQGYPGGQPAGGYGPPPGGYPAGGSYPQAPNPAYPAAGGYPQQGFQPPPPAGYNPGGDFSGSAVPGYPTQPPAFTAQPTAGGFAAPPSGSANQSGGFTQPPAGGASYGGQQQTAYGAPQGQTEGLPYGAPGGVPPQQTSPVAPSYSHSGVPGGPAVGQATSGMANLNVKANMIERSRPTIVPANPFNAEEDAKILRKAMKGFGTDERAIVDVISRRTNKQRQEIMTMFKTLYGKDLIDDLKSELSGDLEELILAMFKPTTFYDAYSLRKAMEGLGTKESVLIEILLTRTNVEIKEIVACYKKNYDRSLEEDIMRETSGHFKRLLVSACTGNRTEYTPEQLQRAATQGIESVIDRNLAREDAQKLYEAGVKKLGTDESAFLQVMAVRHHYQLRATFEEYQKLSGSDILSAVKGEMSGDLEDGFKALVMTAKNRPQYFGERLHKAMAGFGTKDSTLIRVLVSRSEIDLQDVKDEYRNMYGKSLHDAVASETSGDYKKLLLGIVGQ